MSFDIITTNTIPQHAIVPSRAKPQIDLDWQNYFDVHMAEIATIAHISSLPSTKNTPEQHNMVVCTLCSCYPWPVLGIPPAWYKSDAYRSRAVRDDRAIHRRKIRRVTRFDWTKHNRPSITHRHVDRCARFTRRSRTHDDVEGREIAQGSVDRPGGHCGRHS